MKLFNKKEKYVDLSERMRNQQAKIENLKSEIGATKTSESDSNSGGGFFSFFGGNSNASNVSSETLTSETAEEKRRKLSKRLADMTAKMEDLENQIYHLKQQVEVLERKQKIGY